MTKLPLYAEALDRFKSKPILTIAAGATCAYLGDERNLREFLVADETAKRLRSAGHTVFQLLIDDSMDPLNIRQLRVALNKDEALLERHKDWCGKPIGMLPDPFGCHPSYAGHFEQELCDRLNRLGCNPTLVSTVHLYEREAYTPYVQATLERHEEIRAFLAQHFEGYTPEKLFWPLCPHCDYIDATRIEFVKAGYAALYCHRCERSSEVAFARLKGKLNWKLDCAARWSLFKVDAEPFNKAYLEPNTGAFTVAQALSRTFFEGHEVMPLRYGLVKMDKSLSYKLLSSLPPDVLREMMVGNPTSDLNLTHQLMLTTASRHKVLPETSYLDAIKQLLPMWLLTPETLSTRERDLLCYGSQFARNFLEIELNLRLPCREHLENSSARQLRALHQVVLEALRLRQEARCAWEEFNSAIRQEINGLGFLKKDAMHQFRQILGQEQGLPAPRILFTLPLNYLALLDYILTLYLATVEQAHNPNLELAA